MILSFDTPKKARTTEEHNEMHMSESVPGTFALNMSNNDMIKFRAKHIKGKDERIEIKTLIGGANINIFVYKTPSNIVYPIYEKIITAPHGTSEHYKQYAEYDNLRKQYLDRHYFVRFSTNGKINITFEEWNKIIGAVEEAKQILNI